MIVTEYMENGSLDTYLRVSQETNIENLSERSIPDCSRRMKEINVLMHYN